VTLISTMDRKLLRDLWRLRSQVLAIALVIASGVALLVSALTTGEALRETTAAYYERYRFADIFASVTRAPQRLVDRIATLSGVQQVESRIVEIVTVSVPGFNEPATAQIVSLPAHGALLLNQIYLRKGRTPAPERIDEVVLGERFAAAHGLELGDGFSALLNGRQRHLTVVGVALAPEFIYVIGPGSIMPDDKRFGVIWMARDALAAAFDMEEAFNAISLTLMRDTHPDPVVAEMDKLLRSYGGVGAYARDRQLSNRFIQNEIDQQDTMQVILPAIFMAVAAFLTNMIMSRLIATEREEIGLFKAFGYSSYRIAGHYIKMVLVIALLGIGIGFLFGSWLGQFNLKMFAESYQFPFLIFRPSPTSYLIPALVSVATVMIGSMTSVQRAAVLPPSEAMRPPAPPIYRKSRLAGTKIANAIDEPTRMILRRLTRWPANAALSTLGIALSLAVLLLALQWQDAIDEMIEDFYFRSHHQDATISLADAAPSHVLYDIEKLPGVLTVEGRRVVSARIRHAHVLRRQVIIGVSDRPKLAPVRDVKRGPLFVPKDGVLISRTMADILQVVPGDQVTLEILEGRRPVIDVRVVDTFETYLDTPIYMHLDTLSQVMHESRQVNTVHVRIDENQRDAFLATLKDTPRISAVNFREAGIYMFRNTIEKNIMVFISFFTVFACTLAFGVIYNTLRISLAERSRELATLRVLGFSRAEISYILLGESGLFTVAALPLGVLCGTVLSNYIAVQFSTELFRMPLAIQDSTAGFAAVAVLVTVAICALIVRRRLDHLDLIEVLKTRE